LDEIQLIHPKFFILELLYLNLAINLNHIITFNFQHFLELLIFNFINKLYFSNIYLQNILKIYTINFSTKSTAILVLTNAYVINFIHVLIQFNYTYQNDTTNCPKNMD
jgi:hypothetical protein